MFDMGFLRADGLLAADVLNAKGGQLPDLVLVLPDEQVRDAINVMHETGVSQVVVSVTKELPLAAKEVVGTLRELELMDLTFRDDDVLDQPIADVMSRPCPTSESASRSHVSSNVSSKAPRCSCSRAAIRSASSALRRAVVPRGPDQVVAGEPAIRWVRNPRSMPARRPARRAARS
jgi:hypothetical protein